MSMHALDTLHGATQLLAIHGGGGVSRDFN